MVYFECSGRTSDMSSGWYLGKIYLVIPFDTENEQYSKLADYLEDEKGVMRHSNVGCYRSPYKNLVN